MKVKILVFCLSALSFADFHSSKPIEEPSNNAWVRFFSRTGLGTLGFSGQEALEAYEQMQVPPLCHVKGTVKILAKEGQNLSCIRVAHPSKPFQYQCGMTLDLQSGSVMASRWYGEDVGLENLPSEALDAKLCE